MKNRAKIELRRKALDLRQQLSSARHLEASQRAFKTLGDDLRHLQGYILSYAPFRSELDISPLNELLVAKKTLILPKVHQQHLELYLVEDPSSCLEVSAWGMLEPIPNRCKKIDEGEVAMAWIPGLAFDDHNYRLGYGKGFYDNLIPKLTRAITIGIGFHEQKFEQLPRDPWDCPLQKVMLF